MANRTELTSREKWLMTQAFRAADFPKWQSLSAWLNWKTQLGGRKVAEILLNDAPPDTRLAAAVGAEREACAKICDDFEVCDPMRIAFAIRERSKNGG
jgi:hypothetical protein